MRYECRDAVGRSFEDRVDNLEIELSACKSDRDAYRRTLEEIRSITERDHSELGPEGWPYLAGERSGMLQRCASAVKSVLTVWPGYETESSCD